MSSLPLDLTSSVVMLYHHRSGVYELIAITHGFRGRAWSMAMKSLQLEGLGGTDEAYYYYRCLAEYVLYCTCVCPLVRYTAGGSVRLSLT